MAIFDDSFCLSHGIMKSKMSNYETSSFTNWCVVREMKGGPNAHCTHCKVRSSSVATTLLVVWLATCQFLFLSFHIFNWQIMTLRLWVAKWWINTCILHKIIVMLIITSITHLSLPNSFSQTGKISFNDLLPTVATGYNFLSFAQGGHSFWSFTHVLHALLASKK